MNMAKKTTRNPSGDSRTAKDNITASTKSSVDYDIERSRASAAILRAAKVLKTLKKDDTQTDRSGDSEEQSAKFVAPELTLQHSIILNPGLVQRLISMPKLPALQRTTMQSNMPTMNYALSCENELGIWHECDDAVGILNRYPLHNVAARAELPYFVLWALHSVLPEVYQTLN